MNSPNEIYSLPRSRLARWLAAPGEQTPRDIRVALVGTLFGTLPIFFGGVFNTIAVAGVLVRRHPTLPFKVWFFAEVTVCVLRFIVLLISRRRAAAGRSTPTDLYLLLAPLWGATVGYGAFVSAVSGDWVAATLSFLSAAAMVGGICFRNFAAPRLVAVMIFLSLGPCCLGALVAHEPVLLLTLLQIPFYLFAMSVAAQRLNGLLISTMKAEREHSHRARHDALTGLLNREGLFRAANRVGSTPIAAGSTVLFVDLDGFKLVNDAHGHEAGDLLLVQVALRLRSLAGKDALIARMGGDEFVIIDCPSVRPAHELAALVTEAIERPFDLAPGLLVKVGASVGLATVTEASADVDQVLRHADMAMYAAKRQKAFARRHAETAGKTADGVAASPLSSSYLSPEQGD
ncbi:GGDEF domain-containing protein [Paraburkholderia acidisoli]|uniref:Diguanylate cyclase n=1 Tax=Paraburkholderia acidisoli TaxID=2571748 RepID=A0A7Z2GPQ7_9BURK|nr:GGDEF domain-containing protein [Paraburkholderia acidisoli]QGZ65314.1 diguanylate cyclase [Paraburkholderia acidisoli]